MQNATATDGLFIPHLFVGQARTDKAAEQLGNEIVPKVVEFRQLEKGGPKTLDWFVDKVYVIERKGDHDRSAVVGSIDLKPVEQAS